MGVLSLVVELDGELKVDKIASFLDVAPSSVEGVIHGSANALFELDLVGNVRFAFPSLFAFLRDANRAGEFFIPKNPLDTHFTRILSYQLPSDPPLFYSREVLMGVLRVLVALNGWLDTDQIASLLNVAPSSVEGVVFGSAKALFGLNFYGNSFFAFESLSAFLQDADRAGEFYIPENSLDTHFTSITAMECCQPPLTRRRPSAKTRLRKLSKRATFS